MEATKERCAPSRSGGARHANSRAAWTRATPCSLCPACSSRRTWRACHMDAWLTLVTGDGMDEIRADSSQREAAQDVQEVISDTSHRTLGMRQRTGQQVCGSASARYRAHRVSQHLDPLALDLPHNLRRRLVARAPRPLTRQRLPQRSKDQQLTFALLQVATNTPAGSCSGARHRLRLLQTSKCSVPPSLPGAE